MKLKIKFLKWSAGIPVAMLNEKTAEKMGAHILDRILIKKGSKEIITIIDTIGNLVKENEIAVSSEIKKILNLNSGDKLEVSIASPPKSVSFIKDKLKNKTLSQNQINEIIQDLVDNSLSESEIAMFISATYKNGMNFQETIFLIEAFLRTGSKLKFNNKFVADKHSIGGIPGNRTTPVVVSICAVTGLVFPKSSSRAITSATGTAEVIETLAKVDFSVNEIKRIVKKTNACLVWGGGIGMVPADEKIIKIEKQLVIDVEPLLLASIISKKLAVGSNYILIDIPYGKNAKVNLSKAIKLKQKFKKIGKHFKKNLEVVLTKGDQPIGNGIGPVLEMIDVLNILNRAQQGPKDLEKKSVFLAGKLLEMTGKAKIGRGIKMAEEILNSGRAYKKFKEIIKAQGGAVKKLKPGKFKHNILAKKNGRILEINNKIINSLARIAGCPIDKSAGIYLHVHKNHKIKKNEKILTIYSESGSRLREAVRFYNKNKIVMIK